MAMPRTSRRPSVSATATMAATLTIRPERRTLICVQPEIGPFALQWPVKEGVNAFVDLHAQAGSWLLETPVMPMVFQIIH